MDIQTTILGLAVGNLVFGLVLVLFQRREERSRQIPFWATAKILQFGGWLLLFGRGSIPDFLSFTVGNSCLLAGFAYECWTMYQISRRPVSRARHLSGVAGIILVCVLATPLTAPGRIAVASFVSVIFFALPGRAMLNYPGEKSLLRGYVGWSMWLLAVIVGVRGTWALVAPEHFTLFAGNTIQLIAFAALYYVMLTNGFGILLLAKETTDRELQAVLKDQQASNNQLRSLIDHSPLAIITIALDGSVILWNAAAERLYGWTADEVIGRPLPTIAPDKRAEFDALRSRVARGESIAYAESTHRRKDGTDVHLALSVAPLRDADGQVHAQMSIAADITERKLAEATLRESEARFRSYFELPLAGRAITSPDKGWLDVNATLCDMLGYTKAELMQMTWDELTHPDDLAADVAQFNQVLAGEIDGYTLEKRFIHQDGHTVYGYLAVQCLRLPDGSVDYLVALIQDLTERQQAEEALRESEKRFRTLFEQAAVGVALLETRTGRYVDINQRYCDYLGYTMEEMRDSKLQAVTHPDDVQTNLDNNALLMAGKIREFSIEKRYIRKDGTVVWGNLTVSPLWAAGEEPGTYFHIAVVQDITERKRTEQALRESEERYRELVENANDIVYTLDPAGNFTSANRAAERITGYTHSEILALNLAQVVSPDDFALARQMLQSKLSQGQPTTYSLEIYARDGRKISLELSTRLIYHEGRLVGSQGIARDITDRKRAEEALRESQSLYHSLVEVSPLCICRKDLAGRFTFANQRFLEESQITLADLVGKTDFDLHPPGLAEKYRRDDQAVIASEQVRELIEERALVDGETQIVQSIKTPIRDGAGQINGVQISFWDITARQRAEEALHELNATLEQRVAQRTAELQATNQRLTELDHLKDEFLSRTSHELRTPLTSIKIYLELLETGKPDKRDKYLQTLKRETDRLHALIEEVLMFSQLNLNTALSTLESIDPNNLIAGRLTTWQKLSAGHDLQFQLDLAHDLPHAHTDGDLIMQALTRLMANAVNYTPAGSVIVSTARVDENDQQWVTISVKDTGPGITPDDLPHIFERFYRGRAAADYKTPGIGVGLSISREIAEKLGGRLTVETQVGAGSTFTLWLPVAA